MSSEDPGRPIIHPLIHPTQSVSPSALLDSLITVARRVSHHHNTSPIHRLILRNVSRRVSLLLAFLEQISAVHSPALLALSDLFVSLQKLELAMRACARRGATLHTLMRSARVADDLRVSTRAIATALDVLLPSRASALEVHEEEAWELARLVADQSARASFSTDPSNRRVFDDAVAIIAGFERRVLPDEVALRRVLDRLGIRSWADCDAEVSFLETQIGCAGSGEAELLSSLAGLMCYCRVVLFDRYECRKTMARRTDDNGVCAIEDLQCPISLELMLDPVTVSTGQTYDRASIKQWMRAGNLTCPVTGERLASTDLVPNLALKNLIRQFYSKSSKPNPNPNPNPIRSRAASEAMRMTAQHIVSKLAHGTGRRERDKAAYEARSLTKSSAYNCDSLIKAGSVPPLLNLLLDENAIAAVLHLSKQAKGRTAIFECGGLDPIIRSLNDNPTHHAAAIVFYMSSVEEYRKTIGETEGAITGLVELVRRGSLRARRNAVAALFGLIYFDGNRKRVIAAGGVEALIGVLRASDEGEDRIVNDTLAVLVRLSERAEGAEEMRRVASAGAVVVKIMCRASTSRCAKECCVSVLVAMCDNGGAKEVVGELVKMPSLMGALYGILTDGTARASKKARLLLGILHGFGDRMGSSRETMVAVVRVQ
ncbi:U-box domain-containing protein 18 [Acorus calamus]|uniref:RING-type E3 ubiquitin transferase n=1 Tax=Acorus calamus TaxID=4465 RepID=A0AAV9EA42_ACOCL|nr:U-box domain-containing protein 18 [Acorus calamus]